MSELIATNLTPLAQLAVAALVGALVMTGVCVVLLLRYRRHAFRQQQALDALQADVRALCAGAVGLDERIGRLEQDARRLRERQEQIELHDNGEPQYQQAVRMVQKGSKVEELMSVCGLSRGEAELVTMMHRMDAAS